LRTAFSALLVAAVENEIARSDQLAARLREDGGAPLASTSVSVSPGERYRVSVRLLDQGKPVAEDAASLP
jgi:hypothetical protein